MRHLTATIIAIGMCFVAKGASAQYVNSGQLAKVEAIKVTAEATINDGCLDSPDVLKTTSLFNGRNDTRWVY